MKLREPTTFQKAVAHKAARMTEVLFMDSFPLCETGSHPRPLQDPRQHGRVLDEHERMMLIGADQDAFLDAVLDPPKPTKKLLAALRRHHEVLASNQS
ncbi:MAG TPA: DUF1778 domain-containing protein [Thermoanaerobaculia bacterium]|nr:DUF1778 domain-containing protein [Thermoanaerobaculia bacterium]